MILLYNHSYLDRSLALYGEFIGKYEDSTIPITDRFVAIRHKLGICSQSTVFPSHRLSVTARVNRGIWPHAFIDWMNTSISYERYILLICSVKPCGWDQREAFGYHHSSEPEQGLSRVSTLYSHCPVSSRSTVRQLKVSSLRHVRFQYCSPDNHKSTR
ncbi:unnamed protein product [Periconia digitata]|uniref:Uncharacterized protein n=1 Tax=Periconia digitata TaxID=1303443 RepID=A0A9W4U4M5_9PLEO|nr:unnamed protein product [Periconia digitata]